MDLLDQESISDFKGAIRDVTDTFHRYPVAVDLTGGLLTELQCGRKNITAELRAGEQGQEISEGWLLSFNREYLAEQGLYDFRGRIRLTYDTPVWLDGKRFAVIRLKEDAVFHGDKLLVFVGVAR